MISIWKSVDDALDYAIASEEEAMEMYGTLAGQAPSEAMRHLFARFAEEELKHRNRLRRMKKDGVVKLTGNALIDLSRQLSPKTPSAREMTMLAAYRLAINAEKNAVSFYAALARMSSDAELGRLFEELAEEERRHEAAIEAELKKSQEPDTLLKKIFRLLPKP